MHEVGIMQSILATATERAQSQHATRITAIQLRIGLLAGVVPEALEFAFEALRADTLAAEARLQVEFMPVVCYCKNCKTEFRSEHFSCECPTCHREDIAICGGRELDLVSIEVT